MSTSLQVLYLNCWTATFQLINNCPISVERKSAVQHESWLLHEIMIEPFLEVG